MAWDGDRGPRPADPPTSGTVGIDAHPGGVGSASGGLVAALGRVLTDRRPYGTAARILAVVSVVVVIGYVLGYAAWGGREVDLEVYLMGASHVGSRALYSLRLAHVGLYFTYPPFAAAAFTPLRIFPLRVAEGLWGCVNVVAIVGILYVTMRAVDPAVERRAVLWCALVLAGPSFVMQPVLSTLSFGQVNLVLAALVLIDLTSARRVGKPWVGQGALVGIAAAVKLTPLIFVPWLFLTRQVRAGWTALLSFAVCGVVGFAVSPRASVTWWTKDVFKTSRVGGVVYITNQDLQVVIDRFHHAAVSGAALTAVVALLGVGGIALAAVAYRRSSELLGVLVCAVTGLVVSPVTWSHHLVWVLPVVIWLAAGKDRPAFGPAIALCTCVLFWVAPINLVPRDHHRELRLHGLQLIAGNSFFFAMALFLSGVAAMLLVRQHRGRVPDRPPLAVDAPVSHGGGANP